MTRLGLSNEERATLERLAREDNERAAIAPSHVHAFDALRNSGKLAIGMLTGLVEVKALAGRRWAAVDALRRLHARGWQDPCGGSANPLRGSEAAAARAELAAIESAVGESSWPIVVRVVIAGESLRDCHDLLPICTRGMLSWLDDVLLDRLCLALDRVGPLLAEAL